MRFQILAGKHHAKGPNDTKIIYSPKENNIIDTEVDLSQRFGAHKFLRLPDIAGGPTSESSPAKSGKPEVAELPAESQEDGSVATAVANSGSALSKMSFQQLKQYAQELEIDIEGATTRKHLIEVIESSGG